MSVVCQTEAKVQARLIVSIYDALRLREEQDRLCKNCVTIAPDIQPGTIYPVGMKRSARSWIDISVPIHPGLVHWPGDPAVRITWPLRMAKGDDCNVSVLSCCSHTGTHMDAPLHFLPKATTLDQMPLDATIGVARVIEIKDRDSIKPAELKRHRLRRGERILFKTRNSKTAWRKTGFDKHFVHITRDAAAYLTQCGARTVGIDYLSVGAFAGDGPETHRALLSAGIWIIEGLDLSKVKPGKYQLICLPLKVLGSDGAPARAVLRA